MPNSPENYSLITYLWVLGLSILGGTVRTLTHLKMGMGFKDLCRRWAIDIVVSAFIGIITFFLCEYAQGNIMVLGGNQSDAVNIKAFNPARVVGYRFPSGIARSPHSELPILASNGELSMNEA